MVDHVVKKNYTISNSNDRSKKKYTYRETFVCFTKSEKGVSFS